MEKNIIQELPLEYNLEHTWLISFKNIFDDYFNIKNNSKKKDIIIKRFNLDNTKKYTLEELGLFYGLVRERIRQIEAEILKDFKALLNGEIINKKYKLNATIVDRILEFKQSFLKNLTFSKKEFINIIEKELNNSNSFPNLAFIDLIAKLFNLKEINILGNKIYINNSLQSVKEVEKNVRFIYNYLQSEIIPVREFDIIVKCLKKYKSTKKENIFSNLNSMETISKIDDLNWQINIDQLNSVKDYAHFILNEKKTPLHYNKLITEIKTKLNQFEKKETINNRNLTNQLVNDKRFSSIGRTGQWGLSSWSNDTDTIIDLIISAFYNAKKPLKPTELFNLVKKQRSDINKNSISAYLYREKRFIQINNGEFILDVFKNDFQKEIESFKRKNKNKPTAVKTKNINEIVFDTFNNNKKKFLTLKEIYEFNKDILSCKEKTFYNRLNKCKIIGKKKEGKYTLYFLASNYGKILKSRGILNQIEEKIIEILRRNNQRMVYSEIINFLTKKYDYKKPTIYRVVSESKYFSKPVSEGVCYIELVNNTFSVQENTLLSNLMKEILEGENDKTEFKSSLRWDYRKKSVNKDLEFVVCKEITSFLNTNGGKIFIGVDDDGEILGLENDIKTLPKKDIDGYAQKISEIIDNFIGKEVHEFIKISFEKIENNQVAIITVLPSNEPKFIKKGNDELFYIRASTTCKPLNISEALKYIKGHW